MDDLTLLRAHFNDCTIGRLRVKGYRGYIAALELPWRGNVNFTSCIPPGRYRYRVAWSPRAGRNVIWIDGVPDRENIQIHPGNFTSQINGCALVGDGIRDIDGDGIPDVTNSGPTLDKILDHIPAEGWITIREADKPGGGVYL